MVYSVSDPNEVVKWPILKSWKSHKSINPQAKTTSFLNPQRLMVFAVQTQILSASLKKLQNTLPTFTQEEKKSICIISLISKK